MLSKGQGTTMGTYGQLIRALEMDHRAEEAHKFWERKIGMDLHSVPWQLCKRMISIYYRNNMQKNLVKVNFSVSALSHFLFEKWEQIRSYHFTHIFANHLMHICIPFSWFGINLFACLLLLWVIELNLLNATW